MMNIETVKQLIEEIEKVANKETLALIKEYTDFINKTVNAVIYDFGELDQRLYIEGKLVDEDKAEYLAESYGWEDMHENWVKNYIVERKYNLVYKDLENLCVEENEVENEEDLKKIIEKQRRMNE